MLWSYSLTEDFGAEAPEYGFTTTPAIEDDVLIVQTGGADARFLRGFDKGTGTERWSVQGGAALYQSPVVMTLCGERVAVVLTGEEIVGVNPAGGDVLFRHAMGERSFSDSGFPTHLGGNRFLVPVSGQVAAFEATKTDEGWSLHETFRSRELGGSYAAPVLRGDHLYGYRSTFLTCVDARGKRVWKSRPPGGRGLLAVGDLLLVFGAQGVVAAVQATPEGYREHARAQVLDSSSFVWPSFANGHLFVRNNAELARVAMRERSEPSETVARADVGDPKPTHGLGSFFARLDTDENRQSLIDAFLAENVTLPVVEDGWVHFVYEGPVEDIALVGSMVDGSRPAVMHRVPGTDFYHRSFEIEPGARWEYQFQIDFGRRIRDPRNPRTAPQAWGSQPMSEVVTKGYRVPHHLEPVTGSPRGSLVSFPFRSEGLGNERLVQVYLPAGYEEGAVDYPILLVHDGSNWLERGSLHHTLDATIGESVEPMVVAFVSAIDDWWFEAGGTGTAEFIEMVRAELLPELRRRYRLRSTAPDVGFLAQGPFAMTALLAGLEHPDVFGKVATISLSLRDVARHDILRNIESKDPAATRFYLDWCRYEQRDTDRNFDLREHNLEIFGLLKSHGFDVAGGEALDGAGWGAYRARTDQILAALFPQTQAAGGP